MALVVKNPPPNVGDVRDADLIPGLVRPLGEEIGDSLQYSCLENSMDRGAWRAIVHGVTKSQIRLSTWHITGFESSGQCRSPGIKPWVGQIPWRGKWRPTPVFLPGKSHRERSLKGYIPWGHKRVRHDLMTKQQQ